MGGDDKQLEITPLVKVAKNLSEGKVVNKEDVEEAHKKTIDDDREKYLGVVDDARKHPEYYDEHSAEFKKKIDDLRDALLAQVEALENADEAKKRGVFRQTHSTLGEIKVALKERSIRMDAEKFGLDTTSSNQFAVEGGSFGSARMQLAGYLTAYRLLGASRANDQLEKALRFVDTTADDAGNVRRVLSVAAVERILGKDLQKLKNYDMNNATRGYVAGLLMSAREILNSKDAKIYETRLFVQLDGMNGGLPVMDVMDEKGETHVIPLVVVDGLLTPGQFAQEIATSRPKRQVDEDVINGDQPSADHQLGGESDEKLFAERWEKRKPLENETERRKVSHYSGDYVVTSHLLEVRNEDGKKYALSKGMRLSIRPAGAQKVEGDDGAAIYLPAAEKDEYFTTHPEKTFYIRFEENSLEVSPLDPNAPPDWLKTAFPQPSDHFEKQAKQLETKFPFLGVVNVKYIEVLNSLNAFTNQEDADGIKFDADGVKFNLPFANSLLPCRVMKEGEDFVLHFKDTVSGKDVGLAYAGMKGFEQLMLEINNGRLVQYLTWMSITNEDSYDPFTKTIGDIDDLKAGSTPEEPVLLELDWDYPDPNITLNADQQGFIACTVHRKNVGLHGEDIRSFTAGSFKDLMLQLAHVKQWAEMPKHDNAEDTVTQREIAFSALSQVSSFDGLNGKIGRVVSFHIENHDPKNSRSDSKTFNGEVVRLCLDWGAGNISLTSGNPIITMWVEPDGTYSYSINFSGKRFMKGPEHAATLRGMLDALQQAKITCDRLPYAGKIEAARPYEGLEIS